MVSGRRFHRGIISKKKLCLSVHGFITMVVFTMELQVYQTTALERIHFISRHSLFYTHLTHFNPHPVKYSVVISLCTIMIFYFVSGARVLREYTKKNIISQKRELGEILKEKRIKKEFDGLKKKRALNSYQYEILYPKPGTKFQEDKVDISLWVIVARYLIRQETYIAWDEEPGPEDNLWGHHMLR